jgi:plastocyanin
VVLRPFHAALVLASLAVLAADPCGSGLARPEPRHGQSEPPAGAHAQAQASLRGHVEIGRVLSSSRSVSRPGSGDDAGAAAMVPDVYRQAVVFIDPPPERAERPAEVHARMNQKDERFIPHLLAIPVGSVVDFPNEDPIYHNVFSLSKTRRFDLGRYAAGRSKAVRFDQPGIVRVFCEIHSHMNAFILVFDHRFFALTDESGRFHIDRVPPGTYRVTAWYEGVAQQTQTVTVAPATGGEANFVLK